MTWLWILLSILLFFTILLLCPIVFCFSYDKTALCKVRYLFLTFTLYPEKEKKQKNSTEKKEKQTKKSDSKIDFKSLYKNQGLGGIINLFKQAATTAKELPLFIKKHLVVSRLNVTVVVATDDAADTAVSYGKTCAGVYSAAAIIMGTLKCKSPCINVYPDFNKKEFEYTANIKVRISVLYMIIGILKGINIFTRIIRLFSGGSINKKDGA